MNANENMLLIPKIEEGIVIDHIPAGMGVRVLQTLFSYPEMREAVFSIGLNYQSSKLGKKDMIKIQPADIPEQALALVSLISPGITIKRIVDYQVDEGYVLDLPDAIEKLVRCPNPTCVTNHEAHLATSFKRVGADVPHYRCTFCERDFAIDALELVRS